MRIFYNKYLPPKDFGAINLFGVILIRKGYGQLSKLEINHELIHTRQMSELFFVLFYFLYIGEWIVRLVQYRNAMKAYYNISFEREAYDNMDDLAYLKRRNIFSFIRYYKKN